MSRVLFVSTSTTVGGAEKTLYSLATLLDPKAFTVAGVVSLKAPGAYARRLEAQGIPAHSLDIVAKPGLAEIRKLVRIIDHQRPDLVHALMYQAIQLCRIAKRRCETPFRLVSSPRVSYRTRAGWTLFVDRLLKGADDLLIAECKASADYLVKRLGYPPAKVRVVYNGVDIAQWPVSKIERQQKRLELRLESKDILAGTAGRLDAQKGHSVLIDAVHRLRDRLPIRCVILGDGPSRAALQAQIHRLNLEKHVWLLGESDDMVAWLSAMDLFVLPSLWEGLPNSLLEAMALGLPAVASGVDGVPEVVLEGHNGLLVPPKNPAALAEALSRLASDAALRSRLGETARKTVTERFGLIPMIEGYQKAYFDILSS